MTTLHAVYEPDLTASALRISIRTVFNQFLLLLLLDRCHFMSVLTESFCFSLWRYTKRSINRCFFPCMKKIDKTFILLFTVYKIGIRIYSIFIHYFWSQIHAVSGINTHSLPTNYRNGKKIVMTAPDLILYYLFPLTKIRMPSGSSDSSDESGTCVLHPPNSPSSTKVPSMKVPLRGPVSKINTHRYILGRKSLT